MPFSGNLKELPFPEVLRLLGDRTGTLRIVDKNAGYRFSFLFSGGKLVSASDADQPILDTLELHSVIQRLSENEWASFAFEENRAGELSGHWTIPIEQILLSSLAAVRSPERFSAYLPHPGARFRAAAETTPWLAGDLLAFWVTAERLLRSGSSANEIANTLLMPLPQVLLELFKLRLAGVIVPLPAKPSVPLPTPSAPERSGVPRAPASMEVAPPQALHLPELLPPPTPPAPASSPAKPLVAPQKASGRRQGILARIAAGLRGVLERMYE